MVGPWTIGSGVADGLVVGDADGTPTGWIDATVRGGADGPAVCAPACACDVVPPQPATSAVNEIAASSLAYEWYLCISFPLDVPPYSDTLVGTKRPTPVEPVAHTVPSGATETSPKAVAG